MLFKNVVELTIQEIIKEDPNDALEKINLIIPAGVAAHCLSHMYCAGIPTPYGIQSLLVDVFELFFSFLLSFPHHSLV